MADVSDTLGIKSIDWGGMFTQGTNILFWLIVISIIIGVIFFIRWILSFKQLVIIKEPIGEAFEHEIGGNYVSGNNEDIKHEKKKVKVLPFIGSIHKGKIICKRGVYKLLLLSPRKTLKIPDNIFHGITKKGKKFIELTKLSEHIYAPTILSDLGKTEYIYDESYFSWVVNDIEEDKKKYGRETFWDRYSTAIITVVTLILCMIIVIIVLRESNKIVETTANSMAPLAESFNKAAETIGKALENIGNQHI